MSAFDGLVKGLSYLFEFLAEPRRGSKPALSERDWQRQHDALRRETEELKK
ncbi:MULTISPECIES: hypothetical protein [unclassified Sphingomonas]|uniref:hypothetical protein n=1 Tax=unclassified Sphingomonas TaxID=196159 RepID=UPI002151A059|nr:MULTISPECIES: hypothetical protein [unclassified Sphingomonas]MCR5872023.1 hypothetical protein [Sphingomonas sp. J344]UUX99701.1 hypothetical protein LRS08_00540 [Sphingomonas sp. J315]